MPSMKLQDEIEVWVYSNGERFKYRATVTRMSGTETFVTLEETGEEKKLQRRRCEVVSEGEQ